MSGWIAIHRKLIDDVVWKGSTPEQKTILITILLLVDHQSNEWEWNGTKFKTKPGQTVTSLNSIIKASGKGVTTQNVRSALKRFKKLNFLTEEVTKHGRLITIINWATYQGVKKKGNIAGNKEVTKAQHRPNIDLTPNNNVNNETKDIVPEELRLKFNNFIENRKTNKSPMTKHAIKLLLEKVEELGDREACGDINNVFYGCRETGAVKRASLDLTNALADLRKNDAYSN